MATLVSAVSGILNTGTTWNVVNAASFLDSRVSSTTITTSILQSGTFVPGAATISGVLLQFRSIESSRLGTLTVTLRNTTSSVDVISVTINLSDLPESPSSYVGGFGTGWFHFKFATTVTTLASTNYAIRVNSSDNNQVSIFTNATLNNFSRGLVSTSTAALVATDVVIVTGIYSASPPTDIKVTINSNLTTVYGNIFIGSRGTLAFATTASSSLQLRTSGNICVGSGGRFEIGEFFNNVPIPNTSTASVFFSVTTLGLTGLIIHGGWLESKGMDKTHLSTLSVGIGVGISSFPLSSTPTEWRPNDLIVLSSSTAIPTQAELETISSVAGSNVTITAGVNFTHGVTSRMPTYVMNLTRNVNFSIVAPSTARGVIFRMEGYNSSVYINDTHFVGFNGNTKATSAFGLGLTNNSMNRFQALKCSFYNLDANFVPNSYGFYLASDFPSSMGAWLLLVDCVMYNYQFPITTEEGAVGTYNSLLLFDNCVFMRCGTLDFRQISTGQHPDNIISSSRSTPLSVNLDYKSLTTSGNISLFPNLSISSSTGGTEGMVVKLYSTNKMRTTTPVSIGNIVMSNWRIYNNSLTNSAININSFSLGDYRSSLTFSGMSMWSNSTTHLNFGTNISTKLSFNDCFFWNSEPPDVTTTNFAVIGNSDFGDITTYGIYFNNCGFGFRDSGGTISSFAQGTFDIFSLGSRNIILNNCRFSGTTIYRPINEYIDDTTFIPSLVMINQNNVIGNNFIYFPSYTIQRDTTNFNSGNSSIRITPASNTISTIALTQIVRIPVLSGQSCNVSVVVRKSSSYLGSQPNLKYKYNPIVGNNQSGDITCATMSVGNNIWETLSYTTAPATNDGLMEFYVDCYGYDGFVNVDDWQTNLLNDTRSEAVYGYLVGTYQEPDFNPPVTASSETSYTFIS